MGIFIYKISQFGKLEWVKLLKTTCKWGLKGELVSIKIWHYCKAHSLDGWKCKGEKIKIEVKGDMKYDNFC